MKRTTPPFRADHVGSYLRTPAITEARAKRDKGQISAADLKKVEDQEIPKVIKKQEEVGLQCATDGEYRRMFWHYDFYDGLDNVEIYELDHGIQFQGVQTKPKGIRITGKIDFSNHPMLEHFKFVKQPHQGDAEDVHPVADGAAFPAGAQRGRQEGLSEPRRDLLRPVGGVPQGGEGVLRRRLPLSAVRRHRLGLSLLRRRDEEGQGARHEHRDDRRRLHPRHQRLDQGQAGRHGDHHACLPRQLPLDLDCVGRLRADRRADARRSATTTAISWNTTASAPAASSRCASCRRARRSPWSASSRRRAAPGEQGHRQAPDRRGVEVRAARAAGAVARNAASPRRRKATC